MFLILRKTQMQTDAGMNAIVDLLLKVLHQTEKGKLKTGFKL